MKVIEVDHRQFVKGRRKCCTCDEMFSFTLPIDLAIKYIGRSFPCFDCGDWFSKTAATFDVAVLLNSPNPQDWGRLGAS